jgi:hypothetical protein
MKFGNKKNKAFTTKVHSKAKKVGAPSRGFLVMGRVLRAGHTTGKYPTLYTAFEILAFCDPNGRSNNVVAPKDGFFDGCSVVHNVVDGKGETRTYRIGEIICPEFSVYEGTLPDPAGQNKFIVTRVYLKRATYKKGEKKKVEDDEGNLVQMEQEEGAFKFYADGSPIYDLRCSDPIILDGTPNMHPVMEQFRAALGPDHLVFNPKIEYWPARAGKDPKVKTNYVHFLSDTATTIKTGADGVDTKVTWFANFEMDSANMVAQFPIKGTNAKRDVCILPTNVAIAFVERNEDGTVSKNLVVFTTNNSCDFPFYMSPELWAIIGPNLIEAYSGGLTIQYPLTKSSAMGALAEEAYEAFTPEVPEELADNELANTPGSWQVHGVPSNLFLKGDIPATVAACGVEMSLETYNKYEPQLVTVDNDRDKPAPYADSKLSVMWLNQVPPEERPDSGKKYRIFAIFADGAKPQSEAELTALLDARAGTINDVVFVAVRKSHLVEPESEPEVEAGASSSSTSSKRKLEDPVEEGPTKKKKGKSRK